MELFCIFIIYWIVAICKIFKFYYILIFWSQLNSLIKIEAKNKNIHMFEYNVSKILNMQKKILYVKYIIIQNY